jgi:hypothetical protein
MATTIVEYVGPFQGEQHVYLAAGVATTQDRKLELDSSEAAALLEQPDNWRKPKKGA